MRTLLEDYLRPMPLTEIWKDIEGYEGMYQVSNMGRVRNKDNEILYQEANKKGYLRVKLNKDGERKNLKVHRLVATLLFLT